MKILNNYIVHDKAMDIVIRVLRILIISGVIWYLADFLSKLIISPIDEMVKIGIMLALGLPLILLAKPVWSFMALLFTRPLLEPLAFYRVLGSSVLGFVSFLYIIIVVYMLTRNEIKFVHEKLKWYYFFILFAIVSTYNSTQIDLSIAAIMKYLALLSLFLLGYNITKTITDAVKIIKVIVMSSAIPIIYGLYQVATGTGVQAYKSFQVMAGVNRINSFFDLSNGFAFFLGMIIFLIVFCLYNSKVKGEKIYYSVLLAGALVCLVYTHVRTIWLSVFLGMCFLGNYDKKIRKYFIIIIIISIPLTYHLMMERFKDIFVKPEYGTSSLEFRSKLASQLLHNAVPKHLFIGFGPGDAQSASLYSSYAMAYPHNDFLRVLVENGILGSVLYLLFIVEILIYYFNFIRNKVNFLPNLIFFVMLVYYLISSTGQNIFGQISTSGYIFCLLGLSIKLNEINMKSGETAGAK